MVNRKHNNKLTPYARELRKRMTPEERKLWYDFLRTYPVRFLRQKVINRFIVDFYCASAKLVVEIDGGQHFSEQGLAYDSQRDAILSAYGLTTLRYSNMEIETQFTAVCMQIDKFVQEAIAQPSNQLH